MIIGEAGILRAYRETHNNLRGLVKITSDADPNVLSLPKELAKEVTDWDAVNFEDKVTGHLVSFRKKHGSHGDILRKVEANLQDAENVAIEFPDDFELCVVQMANLSNFTDAHMDSLWNLNPMHIKIASSIENNNSNFDVASKIQKRLIDSGEMKWKRLRGLAISVSANSYNELDFKILINGLHKLDNPLCYLILICKDLTATQIEEIAKKPIPETWECFPKQTAELIWCTERPKLASIDTEGDSSSVDSDSVGVDSDSAMVESISQHAAR